MLLIGSQVLWDKEDDIFTGIIAVKAEPISERDNSEISGFACVHLFFRIHLSIHVFKILAGADGKNF